MQLKSSNIKSTVARLSAVQVSKIGKQIGATGTTFYQRRAIEQHIKDHHGTVTKAEGFLKKVGLHNDKKEFSSVMSGFKGIAENQTANNKNSFSNLGAHAQAELIKQASHDEGLRDKIAKDLRANNGERGDRNFLRHVEKTKEDFQERMRGQALQERLKQEGKDMHTFGYQKKAGETNIHNVGTSAQGSESNNNKAGNSQSAPTNDHPKPPTGFNNFAV